MTVWSYSKMRNALRADKRPSLKVMRFGIYCGILREEERHKLYSFTYDADYLVRDDAAPIIFYMPLQSEPHYSKGRFFPFFSNLCPEGSLKEQYSWTAKIGDDDHYGMLFYAHAETVGALDFERVEEEE